MLDSADEFLLVKVQPKLADFVVQDMAARITLAYDDAVLITTIVTIAKLKYCWSTLLVFCILRESFDGLTNPSLYHTLFWYRAFADFVNYFGSTSSLPIPWIQQLSNKATE